MPLSQPFDIMLAHDRWATRQIFTACLPLTEEQFHKPFEMGMGSLHNNATHLLTAVRGWTNNLRGGNHPLPKIDGNLRRTPAEMLAMLDEVSDAFAAEAKSKPLDDTLTVVRDNTPYTFTRGIAITHVMQHAMHHRAQCLNMLRHVGVKPLPWSSVLEWMRSGSPER